MFKTYTNDEHKNMMKVVNWCCEHNLIQQGITILQEGVITFLCERYGIDANGDDREIINQAAAIKKLGDMNSKNIPFEKWGKEAREKRATC
jgi:hypothetical protein